MEKSTSNTRTLQETPYYFGHYLNLAQHNLYLILHHIGEKFELEEQNVKDKEEALHAHPVIKLWENKSKTDQSQKMGNALKKHFRWLEALSEYCDALEYKNAKQNPTPIGFFKEAVLRLRELRNYYTHYGSPKPSSLTAFDLKPIFEISQKAILIRHKEVIKDEADIAHLSSFALYEADNQWFSEKGLAFFICLFLDNKNANTFLKKIPDFKSSQSIKEKTTAACYTNFCARLPEPKLESSDVLLDMLNELDRCPKELFHLLSEEDKKLFQDDVFEKDENGDEVIVGKMDMTRNSDRFPYFAMRYFDETNAFPTLRFQLDLARLEKDKYDKEILEEAQDRRIIEPLHTFGKLQDFNLDTLPKAWTKFDKAQSKNALNNDIIKQFSPHYNMDTPTVALKFVEKEPSWNDVLKAVEVYQHNKNVRETQQGERKTFQLNPNPDVVLSKDEFQNLFLYHYLHKKGWISVDIETFIKNYRDTFQNCCRDIKSGKIQPIALPTMDKNLSQLEKAQIEKAVLAAHLQSFGYDLDPMDLPKDLRRYLVSKSEKSYRQRLLHTVEQKLEETLAIRGKCKDAIANYKSEKDKEKRKRLPFRIGDAATYVAEDIIHFKPLNNEGGGKPNSLQFRFLQAKIAEFSGHRDTIKKYLRELGLIWNDKHGKDFTHPFLHQIDIDLCIGGFDFCLEYAKKKAKWLEYIILEIKGGVKTNKERKKITIEKLSDEALREKYETYFSKEKKPALAKSYDNLPLLLPRGFFNQAITKAMMQNTDYQVNPNDNVVTCLGKLLKGDTQNFYNKYERIYKKTIADKEEITRGFTNKGDFTREVKEIQKQAKLCKKDISQVYRDLKQLNNEVREKGYKDNEDNIYEKGCKEDIEYFEKEMNGWNNYATYLMNNEKRIRFVQSNDRALWLMATDLAKEREKIRDKENSDTIQIDFSGQSLVKIGFDQKEVNNLMTEPRKMEVRVHNKTIEAVLWLRIYGKFRRFLKDRRLEEMLKFFQHDSVLLKRLQSEIDYFDLHREEVFQRTYKLEQKIQERYADDFKAFLDSERARGNIKGSHVPHFQYLKFLEQSKNIWLPSGWNLGNAVEVVNYRNKLEHNELYYTEAFAKLIAFDENKQREIDDAILAENNTAVLTPMLSEQVLDKITLIYDTLSAKIK